jgi:hypothetical protein
LSSHAKEALLMAARERTKELDPNKHATNTTNENDMVVSQGPSKFGTYKGNQERKVLLPLESLITPDMRIVTHTNVQWLLDFAIVGFGKCGTTSLSQWLQAFGNNTHNIQTTSYFVRVRAPGYEAEFLFKQRPAQLVRTMYTCLPWESTKHDTTTTTTKSSNKTLPLLFLKRDSRIQVTFEDHNRENS